MQDNQDLPAEQDPPPETTIPEQETTVPGGTIASAQEQDAAISLTQSQPEDMEVHHHPHIHHKKKWKDYIFEFFMLFLAVSSGFFVENMREHYVEHERAKEYAAMLRKDLVSDTIIMNIIIGFRNEQRKTFDTLRALINSGPFEKMAKQDFFRLTEPVGIYLHLIGNNGTLQQLKSSGSLRYFRDTTLVYALTSYEEDLKHGEYVQGEEKQHCAERVLPFKFRHFNLVLKNRTLAAAGAQNFPEETLVDFGKKEMLEFYNLFDKCAWYNSVLGDENFSRHKKKATSIIRMLEKEYHLDN